MSMVYITDSIKDMLDHLESLFAEFYVESTLFKEDPYKYINARIENFYFFNGRLFRVFRDLIKIDRVKDINLEYDDKTNRTILKLKLNKGINIYSELITPDTRINGFVVYDNIKIDGFTVYDKKYLKFARIETDNIDMLQIKDQINISYEIDFDDIELYYESGDKTYRFKYISGLKITEQLISDNINYIHIYGDELIFKLDNQRIDIDTVKTLLNTGMKLFILSRVHLSQKRLVSSIRRDDIVHQIVYLNSEKKGYDELVNEFEKIITPLINIMGFDFSVNKNDNKLEITISDALMNTETGCLLVISLPINLIVLHKDIRDIV